MGEEGNDEDSRPYVTVEQLREVEAACTHDYLLVTVESRPSPTNMEITTAYMICRFCMRQVKVRIIK